MHAIQALPPPASPAWPAQPTPTAAFTVSAAIGPGGFEFTATNGTQVLARSGWHGDAGLAWAALGSKLASVILRTANRAVS